MVAYETYANALITKGHGHPLWEPDPGEYAPVELGDVGYLYKGAFIKLFNATKDIDDPSNRLGLPRGHHPLLIRDVIRITPLPKAPEYISTKGVHSRGVGLTVTTGTFSQAGGGFSFECSHQQGALLIMGDVAFRQDASNQKEFAEYLLKHRRSWLEFADSLGLDLSLSDLILVDGCDKTSEWACAAWSDKTSSLRLNFIAGAPGIAEGNACLWGQWDCSESLDKNVGPQPLIPSVAGSETGLRSTSQPSDAMSIDEPAPLQPPISNQCVFVRGFQMADRATWFKRKRIRIDVGSGFKAIQKSMKTQPNNTTTIDRHLPSSEGSQSTPRGALRALQAGTKSIHSLQTPQVRRYYELDEEAEVTYSNIEEHITPAEALIDYIFKHSTAQLALIHNADIIKLLQDSSNVKIDNYNYNYNSWIEHLAPTVYLVREVGMLLGTYNLRTLLDPYAAYVQTEERHESRRTKDKMDGSLAERLTHPTHHGTSGVKSRSKFHTMQLNNYLQRRYGNMTDLSWEFVQMGHDHKSDWVAVAYFKGIEYGRGVASHKTDAREQAAHQALVFLTED